jgi:molybdopterin-guanine dinucleotide biosynthesis protein A
MKGEAPKAEDISAALRHAPTEFTFLSFLNVNTPDDYRRLQKADNGVRGNP